VDEGDEGSGSDKITQPFQLLDCFFIGRADSTQIDEAH